MGCAWAVRPADAVAIGGGERSRVGIAFLKRSSGEAAWGTVLPFAEHALIKRKVADENPAPGARDGTAGNVIERFMARGRAAAGTASVTRTSVRVPRQWGITQSHVAVHLVRSTSKGARCSPTRI